jgi:hypothetical protein
MSTPSWTTHIRSAYLVLSQNPWQFPPYSPAWLQCAVGILALCYPSCTHQRGLAQGFFSFRIYVFSQKIYVPALICILALLQLVGSAVICATSSMTPSLPIYLVQWGWLLTAIWSITASNDMLVTLSLVTILIRQRSHALRRYASMIPE